VRSNHDNTIPHSRASRVPVVGLVVGVAGDEVGEKGKYEIHNNI